MLRLWSEALDRGRAFFVDYKAFDRTDHTLLLNKLVTSLLPQEGYKVL